MYNTRHYNGTGGPDTYFKTCLKPASADLIQTTVRVPYERDQGPHDHSYSYSSYNDLHVDFNYVDIIIHVLISWQPFEYV